MYALTWDLDSIFPGGSQSKELTARMDLLAEQLNEYQTKVKNFAVKDDAVAENLTNLLNLREKIANGFSQCSSFLNALMSADVTDVDAKIRYSKLTTLSPIFQLSETILAKKFTEIDDENWASLLEKDTLKTVAFRLSEIRRDGNELLSEEAENIINTLSLDGLNAWSQHYDTLVATIEIPFTDENGKLQQLSAGQAFNKMMGDPNPEVRATLFATWEKVWGEKSELFGDTLNHLDGFRLSTYKLHGVTDYLKQPLEYNRMSKATLDAMWSTIQKNKQPIVDFLTRKAQLFGKEKMEWQDQDAPIILDGMKERTFTYDEAAAFILENFRKFSPKMADFAQMAFEKSWIEAEDRPGKRPGGYCTELPETQESRIFMTYSNSINEVATLAHELGHAFHSSVLWDIPRLNQDYAMNVAETASTFAELIVADATLKGATSKAEKINLLDAKMQNAIAMFMNCLLYTSPSPRDA